ncbi:MAG TPA: hypothetical protein VES20_11710 [Bryobacteraceae bacterium]|nr:hypothetical protein [Bryobacteraceae bacterium]
MQDALYPPQGQTKLDEHRFITTGVGLWSEEVAEFIRSAGRRSHSKP